MLHYSAMLLGDFGRAGGSYLVFMSYLCNYLNVKQHFAAGWLSRHQRGGVPASTAGKRKGLHFRPWDLGVRAVSCVCEFAIPALVLRVRMITAAHELGAVDRLAKQRRSYSDWFDSGPLERETAFAL